jgi:hypothetical protein
MRFVVEGLKTGVAVGVDRERVAKTYATASAPAKTHVRIWARAWFMSGA